MKHFIKFCVVGFLGTITNLGIFYVFVDYSGFSHNSVATIAFFIAATQNYVLNHTWTFRDQMMGQRVSFVYYSKFVLSALGGLAVNLIVLNVADSLFSFQFKVISQSFGIGAGMLVNFTVSKLVVFTEKLNNVFNRLYEGIHRVFPFLVLALGIIFIGLAAGNIYGFYNLDHASGGWATLAVDLAKHGLFYRPLFGELGYGGSRYFPLHFILHGALIRLGLAAVPAGRAVTLIAFTLFTVALFAILKGQNRSPWLLLAALFTAGVSYSFIQSLSTVKGDLLACALSLGGLAVFLKAEQRQRRPVAALLAGGGLFLLAFATKFTVLYGPAAVLLYFLLNRRWKQALFFALYLLLGIAALLLLFQALSRGLFLDMLQTTILGGSDIREAAKPLSQRIAVFSWFFINVIGDPATLLLFAAALVLCIRNRSSIRRSLIALAFIVVAVETFVMFQFPGVWINHLLDLVAVSLILILTRIEVNKRTVQAFSFILVIFVCTTGTRFLDLIMKDNLGRHRELGALIEEIEKADRVLSENSWFPIMAGRDPLLIDAFMLRVLSCKNPEIRRDLMDGIRDRQFDMILLVENLDYRYFLNGGRTWYDAMHYGPPFDELLRANYYEAGTLFEIHIWRPRSLSGEPQVPETGGSAAADGGTLPDSLAPPCPPGIPGRRTGTVAACG